MFIDYISLMLINMVAGLFNPRVLCLFGSRRRGSKTVDSRLWHDWCDRPYNRIAHDLHLVSSRQLQYCLRGNVSFVGYRIHRCFCRPSPKQGVGNSYDLRIFRRCGCYLSRLAYYYSRYNNAANTIRAGLHPVGTRRRLRDACAVAAN